MIKNIINKLSGSSNKTKNLSNEIYKPQIREVGDQMPSFQVYKEGIYQQCDLLFLPEDNVTNHDKLFWTHYDMSKASSTEKQLYKNILRSFLDTDDNINYIITDIVKPSKISKIKKGLYYKYYDKDKYLLNVPENESDFEYTNTDIFINAKWVKYKTKIKNLIIPDISNNEGYKYCLVVVDAHSKKCDAVPLKDKSSDSIINAFKSIYNRKILMIPKVMHVDAGTEFKGKVADYLVDDLDIKIRVADVQRHRQQALVERKNQTIGTIIFQLQAIKELETKTVNTEWVNLLPSIIKEINNNLPKPIMTQPSNFPYFDKSNQDLLSKGSLVRIALNHPINLNNNKTLTGKFRSGDAKWTLEKYPITEIFLKPSQPPMYLTTHDESFHTRQQLQFV